MHSSFSSLDRMLPRAAALALGSLLCLSLALPALANHPKTTVFVSANDKKDDSSGCGKEKNPCDTIQRGIDHAVAGDTLRILKGTYRENAVIPAGKDGLTLKGEDARKVVLVPAIPDSCSGDPGRTTFTGGPRTQACRLFDGDSEGCSFAWAMSRSAAVSCFYEDSDSTCRGCAQNNQNDSSQCTNSCEESTGAGIHVESANVSIQSLTVRGGIKDGISVGPGGMSTRITRVNVSGSPVACVAIAGASSQLKQSQLRFCGNGVVISADDVVVRDVSLSQCGEECISVEGNGARIEGNEASLGGSFVNLRGNGAVVNNNSAELCSSGIIVEGNSMTVRGNSVESSGQFGMAIVCDEEETACVGDPSRTFFAGGPNSMACRAFDGDEPGCDTAWAISNNSGAVSCFWRDSDSTCRGCAQNNQPTCTNTCQDLPCTEGLVADNVVTDSSSAFCYLIRSNGDGLVVEDNRASRCAGGGFILDGTGIVARRNEATTIGSFPGVPAFSVEGDDNLLTKNVAKGSSGDGFTVAGDSSGNSLVSNTASKNAADGFDIDADASGTTLDGNVAKGNIHAGIEVSADATVTTVTGNKAAKNEVDFCDQGTSTFTAGNDFGSVGTCLGDSSGFGYIR